MNTPENLTFSTEQFYKRYNPSNYFLGFLRDESWFLHAHSKFNYADSSNTTYINQLSTFHAHIKGYVEQILGREASSLYDENPKNLETIQKCTPRMIAEIINFSPEYIDYIVIPCAREREEILKKHYMQIGENFMQNGLVQKIGYYRDDSVFFQILR